MFGKHNNGYCTIPFCEQFGTLKLKYNIRENYFSYARKETFVLMTQTLYACLLPMLLVTKYSPVKSYVLIRLHDTFL